jgi:PAS domain S-box-containing protein
MFNDLKIGTRLTIGITLILVLFTALTLFGISRMEMLSRDTTLMYRHPLTVSNAILRIESNIIRIHRTMKDVALSGNPVEIQALSDIVDTTERSIYDDFNIIDERFLGQKSLYINAYGTFAAWKSIRDEVIALMYNGRRTEAANITKGKGARHVEKMEGALNELSDFAADKAIEFLNQTKTTSANAFMLMYTLLAILVFLAALFAYWLTSTITLPVLKLHGVMVDIGRGYLDTNVEVSSGDEIGELGKEVQNVTHTLRDVSELAMNVAKGDFSGKVVTKGSHDVLGLAINTMVDNFAEVTRQAEAIASGDFSSKITPRSRMDTLGIALLNMTESLRESFDENKRQARLMDLIFEHTLDSVVLMDKDFNFIRVSDSYARSCKRDPSEFHGKNHFETFPSSLEQELELYVREKRVYKSLCKDLVFPDHPEWGTTYWDLGLVPILDKNGEVELLLFTLKDITEQKKMEEDRLRMQKLESLGVLAGGIAHDFNNLLAMILSSVSLIKDDTDPEDKDYKFLTHIENAALSSRDLTQQLITFARGGKPVKDGISVKDTVKSVVYLALTGSNVKCDFSFQVDLPLINADKGQIEQLISNLILNAKDAMPKGGTVYVSAESVEISGNEGLPLPDGVFVKVTIRDNGIGIPENILPKIFDPYFTTKDKGNGLGLATSYSIVKNHGGHIEVFSKPNEGTTFNIYLPHVEEAEPIARQTKKTVKTGKGRILVMDDEAIIRDLLEVQLTRLGYECSLTKNGEEALELFKKVKESESPFEAVILDLTIKGGMGGRETMGMLLQIDPDIKGIVSSGYSDDAVMSNYEKYGFSAAVAKPYGIDKLSKVLHQLLIDQNE